MNWWILKNRLHSSWWVAVICLGFLIGVVLTEGAELSKYSSWTWPVAGLILLFPIFARRYAYLLPFAILAGLMIGLWRGSVHVGDLSITKQLYGHNMELSGSVREDVDTDSKGRIVIRLIKVSALGHELPGSFWLTLDGGADIKRGDIVTVEGEVGAGFGSFVATVRNAELLKIERPTPGDIALQARDWFAGEIREVIPDPQASLGIGYLVGQKRALPEDLELALQITGLTHVVVASGYNLTILVRLARRLFEKVSKYLSALVSGLMIFSFMAVTGLSPSMSRAGLVAGLSLATWYYGRKFNPVVLLFFAAAVTVAVNPSYIAGDLGWQLSFAAFAGVMILAPLLQRYFFGEKKPGFIRQIFFETLSAFVCTAPILMVAFGQISNVAIIANIFVLPLVPLAMGLTFVAGLGSLLLSGFGWIVALPANWLLGYMTWVARTLSELPWALREVEISVYFVAAMYVAIIGLCIYMWRRTGYNLRDSNVVE